MTPKQIAALLALALMAVGCGGDSESEDSAAAESTTVSVSGTMLLREYAGRGAVYDGPRCQGAGGYSDIRAGAAVVIRNAQGDQVGLGKLDPGAPTREPPLSHCEFAFTVEGVPDDEGMLTVEVGSRGEVPFDRANADAVSIRIG